MARDAFERAADGHERLEDSGRRALGVRTMATIMGGTAVGRGITAAAGGGGFESIGPDDAVLPIAALAMAALVARGKLKMSPLWHVGVIDGLRVQRAVMTGRAVRRPELAGPAVSTAQYAGKHRWMGIVALLCMLPLAWTLGLTLGWIGWTLGAVGLVPAALVLAMGMNAARAETANRTLLDG